MKLLMTADAVGGVWQYATDLATALVPHGVETVIALLGPAPGKEQDAPSNRHPLGSGDGNDRDRRRWVPAVALMTECGQGDPYAIIRTDLPLDWFAPDPAAVLAAGDAVAALARNIGADLIQLNSPSLGACARFPAPVVAVEHGCVATWWQAVRSMDLPPEFHWQRDLAREGLGRADAIVAPSAAHADAVARAYRLGRRPAAIHNGRRPLALPPEVPPAAYAFTAGRLWDEAKRTPILDAAAARANTPIRAAGPLAGPSGQRVSPTHLDCLGRLSEGALSAELAAHPIFVSAAVFEPFGLAVLEAAQAGCALVLSDIATFRELWDGSATFVAPDDAPAFAAAIDALAADPSRRAALGEAAAERAHRYTPAANAAAMAALYAGLLAHDRAAA